MLRVQVQGFKSLKGYQGSLHRFTILRREGDRFPSAQTCMNTVQLPPLTEEILRERLLLAIRPENLTFFEGAAIIGE